MRALLFVVMSVFAISAQADCKSRPVLLIPGFFNLPSSDVQHGPIKYFSKNIVQTVQKTGREVIVFENLDPLGTVEINEKIVEANIIYFSQSRPDCQFDVIAHSAGGLYLAKALTRNPSLPVANVVTISTPYKGAEIVDFAGIVPGWDTVTSFLDLQGLAEFDPEKMDALLATLVIPEHIRWIVIGAEQEPCFIFSCVKAQKLSWVMTLAWEFFGEAGDGVVSVDSALLTDKNIMNENSQPKTIERWQDLTVPLEHWEIVLDPGLFTAIGVGNTDWLRTQQEDTFRAIVERL